jgi:uncharacterized cofD-like protein
MRVVAFGGGHGLGASLRALRTLRGDIDLDITAVVTVGDDGGSSGRLRAQRGGLPPGDLRMALAALADPTDPTAARIAELLQHRFASCPDRTEDDLGGHAVGNVVLAGLMELTGDPVVALDRAGELVRAVGRVLPMTPEPLWIEATVRGDDRDHPEQVRTVRGQHNVAVTRGVVEQVRITPVSPPACREAVAAIDAADWLLFGPGSWFTSVIPHLLVPDLANAIARGRAHRLVTLNLAAEHETASLSVPGHLRALARYLPGPRVDVVLADPDAVGDPVGLRSAAESLHARVVLAPVAEPGGRPRHDPVALAKALRGVLNERDG